MLPPSLILVGVGALAAVALGLLAILIIGIRRGDRSHLAKSPESRSDALARRILVGVRYPSESSEGEDQ